VDDAIAYSELDSRRFGKLIYRARVETLEVAERAARFSEEARIDMMIARCSADRHDLAQRLESGGFFLTDTLVYYATRAPPRDDPLSPEVTIRDATPADRPDLERLARASFSDFRGHYHTDSRLDKAVATEGYVEWSCSGIGRPRHLVLLASYGGRLAGFLTATILSPEKGEIILNGVDPEMQRRGIYGALVQEARRRLSDAGVREVIVSTQLSNVAPQKTWTRNGFEPTHAFYTFHRWFTP
jgi:ribosomal protein S18 acetylase RimI-like enzyme